MLLFAIYSSYKLLPLSKSFTCAWAEQEQEKASGHSLLASIKSYSGPDVFISSSALWSYPEGPGFPLESAGSSLSRPPDISATTCVQKKKDGMR